MFLPVRYLLLSIVFNRSLLTFLSNISVKAPLCILSNRFSSILCVLLINSKRQVLGGSYSGEGGGGGKGGL